MHSDHPIENKRVRHDPVYSIVHEAILDQDLDTINLVINPENINLRSESDLWNYLHVALLSVTRPHSPKIVEMLIEKGVDVNARDRFGWTPLHFATRSKKDESKTIECVRLLLNAGADVKLTIEDGVSPLDMTVRKMPYNLGLIRLLVESGADPDADFGSGTFRDFLHMVVPNPQIKLVIKLLSEL